MIPKEFIKIKIREISEEGIKRFPDDFLFPCEIRTLTLPSETLVIGNEFFGSYEVLTVNGDAFCHTDSLIKAKYYVYSGKQKEKRIKIPVNDDDIEMAVKNYEKYLDRLLKQIEKDYRSQYPENKDVNSIVNDVFRLLNLQRI